MGGCYRQVYVERAGLCFCEARPFDDRP